MNKKPIPNAALDDRLGFVGTSGSGKTYAAKGCVERLLEMHHRVVIIDPLVVWFGLRLMTDGRRPAFPIAILGGKHGDIPLNEHSGALIGEAVARSVESCIVSLTGLKTSAARQRFMLAFLDALYERTDPEARDPYHVVFDEADLWAPQKPMGQEAMLAHLMEEIVRRGRVKGFIPWLITQRPAVINKNVLSQVDGLIAMKLTSSQDRDALGAWIEGQADRAQGKEILAALPTLPRGEGVIWLPGRGILNTAAFPENSTFDSSRTPKRGEKKRQHSLKPLDLPALKDKLAAVEAETKANDPKALRAEVARLNAELAKKSKSVPVDPKAIEAAEQRGFDQAKKKLGAAAEKEFKARLGATITALRGAGDAFASSVKEIVGNMVGPADLKGSIAFEAATPAAMPRPAASVAPRSPQRAKPAAPNGDGIPSDRPLGAERKPLAALASVAPAGMTEAQWAVAAGLKRSGGTWSTYVSRLRTAGRIYEQGGEFFATDEGLNDLGADVPQMPLPGPGLVAFWASRIPAAGPMLRRLAEVYPGSLSREQLGADLNLAPGGGTFGTYLSRLRSPGLIEEDADKNVRAAPMLMEGRAAA